MAASCKAAPVSSAMALPIEDYALIGDCETAALVGCNGSINWLCLPRFDSEACFAAILGDHDNGRWLIAATDPKARITRRYRPDTLILETRFETDTGAATLIDFMYPCEKHPHLVRLVVGEKGSVEFETEFVVRFGYGEQVPWLPGYEKSAPVRVGNAAHQQTQLDVYGELLDALHQARKGGLAPEESGWELQLAIVKHLEDAWQKPDQGIWEVRSGPENFVYSKIMAWVAFDRSIKSAERFKLKCPLKGWREIRETIHKEVCEKGFDKELNSFVRSYGSKQVDASLLLIAAVGFLPGDDPRVAGTVAQIEKTLMKDGLVQRYDTSKSSDGLPPGEGMFLACSFWLVDAYLMLGRKEDAVELFEKLLALRNDVGLLSEEYDTTAKRLCGNFPQAFSHLALVNSASNLGRDGRPVEQRCDTEHGAKPAKPAAKTPAAKTPAAKTPAAKTPAAKTPAAQ